LKLTDFRDTALYSLTGTFSSPKLIDPVQIARAIAPQVSQFGVGSWVPGLLRQESCACVLAYLRPLEPGKLIGAAGWALLRKAA
jgi:hypothetical protein